MLRASLAHNKAVARYKDKPAQDRALREWAMERRARAKLMEQAWIRIRGRRPDPFGFSKGKRADILIRVVEQLMRADV